MPELPPVVHILPAEPFGGLQTLVIELARTQRAKGRKVDIVLLNPSERVEARCRAVGITPVVLDGPKLGRAVALSRLLRQHAPAILHGHCEPVWALPALAARGRRWVVHLHVYALQKSLTDRFGNMVRRFFARRFIAISHSVGDSFIELGLAPAERVHVVHNGLDLTPAGPSERADAKPYTIGFVGRAVREKGLFDFIEVADLLRDDPNLRFVIAGEGGDLEEARAMIAARSLDDRVTVLGFVEDIGALWRDLDMLLMLSTREPFGLVILEAIAAGVAVLGYDLPSGGNEVMAEIPGCVSVEPFSIQALADAIREVLANRATFGSRIAAGQCIVSCRFSMNVMEAGIAQEYARLIGR